MNGVKLSKSKWLILLVTLLLLPREIVFSSDGSLEVEDDYSETATLVTVRYQDEFGNDLLLPYIASRNEPGALYIINYHPLPDHDLIQTIGPQIGFHGVEDVEIVFVYRRRPTITIAANLQIVTPQDMVTYTITITNNGKGRIQDTYIVRLFTSETTSPVNHSEFRLDYLEKGETIIEISMAIDSNTTTGSKKVTAYLIHPHDLNIDDTSATISIEVSEFTSDDTFMPDPDIPENQRNSEYSNEMTQAETSIEFEFENNEGNVDDAKNNNDKKDKAEERLYELEEEDRFNQEMTVDEPLPLVEGDRSVEVVEVIEKIPFTMLGTFGYDLLIVSAISGKLVKLLV